MMTRLSLEGKLRLNQSVGRNYVLWQGRYRAMGKYATGPSSWARKDLTNPTTIQQLETAEQKLSDDILIQVLPHIQTNHKMMVVGFGPGRRLPQYLGATYGKCFGVDFIHDVVESTQRTLLLDGWTEQYKNFKLGYATNILEDHPPGSFDWVMWERLGNHLTNDEEWKAGLEEALSALKVGGKFVLAESILDFMRRAPGKGSKFRSFSRYLLYLDRRVRLCSAVQTMFLEDGYIIAIFEKVNSSIRGSSF